MSDIIRLSSDLGAAIKQARQAAGLSVTEAAKRAGRVRDVIYRLEAGHDVSLASLFAVLSAVQLNLRLEHARMPTLEEVLERFGRDDDDD